MSITKKLKKPIRIFVFLALISDYLIMIINMNFVLADIFLLLASLKIIRYSIFECKSFRKSSRFKIAAHAPTSVFVFSHGGGMWNNLQF
jgi:hypothetical protein